MVLLPIEWVKIYPKPFSLKGPGGASRPWRDRIGGKKIGFRSDPLSSARHLSPIPFRKTEPLVRVGQPKKFPTQTHERATASLCPAMDGRQPLSPGQSPLIARENMGRSIIDRNHPLDWEKTPIFFANLSSHFSPTNRGLTFDPLFFICSSPGATPISHRETLRPGPGGRVSSGPRSRLSPGWSRPEDGPAGRRGGFSPPLPR